MITSRVDLEVFMSIRFDSFEFPLKYQQKKCIVSNRNIAGRGQLRNNNLP